MNDRRAASLHGTEFLTCRPIPEPHRAVVAAAGENLTIRRKRQRLGRAEARAERFHFLSRSGIPNSDGAIRTAGGKQRPSLRKGQRAHAAEMSVETSHFAAGCRFPKANGSIATGGGEELVVGGERQSENFAAVAGKHAFVAGARCGKEE